MISFVVFCAFASLISISSADMQVVCYYGSWAVYRPGAGKFDVENINPFICTHLIYGFVGLSGGNTIRVLDAWNELPDNGGKNAFGRFNKLKNVNPNLKTLVAIGGWNEGSTKYSAMASSHETRKIFIDSAVAFLKHWGFDGLDVDWEYPASRGGKAEDKNNYVLLLKELKEAFKPAGYLLTAAVGAGKATMDAAYNIKEMSKYVDSIHVMAYDYHGAFDGVTGYNAPLYARPEETGNQAQLNINYSIHYWIDHGAPRKKIILGMALYGRSFTLQNADQHELGAPAPQAGRPGPYTREPGMLGYNEICVERNRWQVGWADHSDARYAFEGDQWVSYDDTYSIRDKSQFAKDLGLGGGMAWSIDTDDFQGICRCKKFPLINVIHETLRGRVRKPCKRKPTGAPRPTEGPEPTSAPSGNLKCTSSGWFSDPCAVIDDAIKPLVAMENWYRSRFGY